MREEKFHRESVEGVEAVLQRMWEAVGKPLVGYAQSFDVSENDIKNWRRRGRVARGYLEGFASEHGVSLDWLLHGDAAPQPPESAKMAGSARAIGEVSEDEVSLLDNYRRCAEQDRRSIARTAAALAQQVEPKPEPRQPKTVVVLEAEHKGRRTGPQIIGTEYTGKRTGPKVVGRGDEVAPKKKRKDEAP